MTKRRNARKARRNRKHMESERDLPVLLTIEEGARALRIGRTKIYELLAEGALVSVRIGRRRLIHVSEVRRYAASLTDDKRGSK